MPNTLTLIRSYDEVDNIRTFVFSTDGLSWQPGQYQTYRLSQAGEGDAAKRFFTIASAPSEGEIHISTRVTQSSFKQALDELHAGDTIDASGLEGDFTWLDTTASPVLLVAAGIGVTPYRSMLLEREALGLPLSATLLYFTRDSQIPFKAELDRLAAHHSELAIEYVVGEPVTAEAILRRHTVQSQAPVYLSGPEAMVDAIGDELTAAGVTLKQDWFPGYSEVTF